MRVEIERALRLMGCKSVGNWGGESAVPVAGMDARRETRPRRAPAYMFALRSPRSDEAIHFLIGRCARPTLIPFDTGSRHGPVACIPCRQGAPITGRFFCFAFVAGAALTQTLAELPGPVARAALVAAILLAALALRRRARRWKLTAALALGCPVCSTPAGRPRHASTTACPKRTTIR